MSTAPPRVVIDPGVLIAGFISSGGTTGRLLDVILEGRVIAVVSPMLIRELHTVLLRDKFRPHASPEEVDAFVRRLLACAELVDDPRHIPPVTRDLTTTTSSRWPEQSRMSPSFPVTVISSLSTSQTSTS